MNAAELAALLALAETGLASAINLYKTISANVPGAKPLADVLADADSTFSDIEKTAENEVKK